MFGMSCLRCPLSREIPDAGPARALQSTYAPDTAAAGCVRDRVRAEEAVRHQCPDGVEADRRSANLARWQAGGLHACRPSTWRRTRSRCRSGLCPSKAARRSRSRRTANPITRPRWSPDSKRIAYISDRGGSSQIWMMDPDGGNAKQITRLSTEADGHIFSPDGKNLVFTSSVYPECAADDACNAKNLDEEKASKVKARIYTELLYRHWTGWQGKRRSHLMVMPAARRTRPRPHARQARRAALLSRRHRRLRHLAQRPGGLLQHECRPACPPPAPIPISTSFRWPAASPSRSPSPWARIPIRATRRTESTSPGARSSAPAMKATAGD